MLVGLGWARLAHLQKSTGCPAKAGRYRWRLFESCGLVAGGGGGCPLVPSNPFAHRHLPIGQGSAGMLPLEVDSPGEIVTESLPSNEPGTQKRRSTRIVQAIPITVSGTDALGQPFKERTTTVMVNCHGCKYQSKHYVPKNSIVKLDIPQPEGGPFHTQGRVVWVQRPRTVRELFQIGLEFEVPGNFWGIAFPPEDWAWGVDK